MATVVDLKVKHSAMQATYANMAAQLTKLETAHTQLQRLSPPADAPDDVYDAVADYLGRVAGLIADLHEEITRLQNTINLVNAGMLSADHRLAVSHG